MSARQRFKITVKTQLEQVLKALLENPHQQITFRCAFRGESAQITKANALVDQAIEVLKMTGVDVAEIKGLRYERVVYVSTVSSGTTTGRLPRMYGKSTSMVIMDDVVQRC